MIGAFDLFGEDNLFQYVRVKSSFLEKSFFPSNSPCEKKVRFAIVICYSRTFLKEVVLKEDGRYRLFFSFRISNFVLEYTEGRESSHNDGESLQTN